MKESQKKPNSILSDSTKTESTKDQKEVFSSRTEIELFKELEFFSTKSKDSILQEEDTNFASANGAILTIDNTNLSEMPTTPLAPNNFKDQPLTPKQEEDRYEVIETLGKGGMGEVQCVKDRILNRKVALKKIRTHHIILSKQQQAMLWRLKREAEITAILEHPNIVPLYDIQKQPDGELYFTMRKVEGETLRNLIKKIRQTKKSKQESYTQSLSLLNIFFKVCDAIAYAHSQGVIHRDLKPDNIMVGEFGEVYVMDWGIAKFIGETQEEENILLPIEEEEKNTADSFYSTIGGLGTPGYMPPEQAKEASEVSFQADIYALGKILKQCFTFIAPDEEFRMQIEYSRTAKEKKIDLKKEIEAKQNLIEKIIPLDVKAIINKATHENWEQRYTSIAEFVKDIDRYQKNIRVSVRDYNSLEIIIKWVKRNKKSVLAVFMGITLWTIFLAYSHREREQQVKKAIKNAFEKKKLSKSILNSTKKSQPLLKALSQFNLALSLQPGNKKIAQEKFTLCKDLILIACKNKDYPLAEFLVDELATLSIVPQKEKQKLKEFVQNEKSKIAQKHLKQFNSWIKKLKDNPTLEDKENAIFEIAKMAEPEIFKKLVKHLQEGTQYFLDEKNATHHKDEFYQVIAIILGRLGNPEAGKPLITALQKIYQNVISRPRLKRKRELPFMIALSQSIGHLEIKDFASVFDKIRLAMGQDGLFWEETRFAFQTLARLDQKNLYLKDSQGYYQRGKLKYFSGDSLGALADYNEALKRNPRLFDAYLQRGLLLQEKNEWDKAILDFSQAIQISSNSFGAYIGRGSCKHQKGDFVGALQDVKKAMQLKPNSAIPYFKKGSILVTQKKLKEAIANFERAIQLNPEFSLAYIALGKILLNQKNIHEALKNFTIVIQLEPRDYQGYMLRGQALLYYNQEYKGAIFDLDKAIEINPKIAALYSHRAEAKKYLRLYKEAVADYDSAIQLVPNSKELYLSRGILKKEIGDLEGALADFNKRLQIDPQSGLGYYYRGTIYAAENKIDLAISDFNTAIETKQNWIEAYLKRAEMRVKKKQIEHAIKDYKKIIEINPKYSNSYSFIAHLEKQQKNFKSAIVFYQKALQYNPNYIAAHFSLGECYLELQELKKALASFRIFIQKANGKTTKELQRMRKQVLQKFPELKK